MRHYHPPNGGERVQWGNLLIPILVTAAIAGGASFVAQSIVQAERHGALAVEIDDLIDDVKTLYAGTRELERLIRETRDILVLPNTGKIRELDVQIQELRKQVGEINPTTQRVTLIGQTLDEIRKQHQNLDILLYRMEHQEKALSDVATRMELHAQIVRNMQEDVSTMRRVWAQRFPVLEIPRDQDLPPPPPARDRFPDNGGLKRPPPKEQERIQ